MAEPKKLVLRTEEDRDLMAEAIWSAQVEPLKTCFGAMPPPFMVASALSLTVALRAEHPEVTIDEAMASAAVAVTAYLRALMCSRGVTNSPKGG